MQGKRVDYRVDVNLNECPVSLIEDGTPELVIALERAKNMQKEFGLPIFTKPLNQWPGKWVEALEVIHRCSVEEHNARVQAETKALSQK